MSANKDALDDLFDRYDAKQQAAIDSRKEAQSEENTFRQEFTVQCKDVIRPTLEGIGERLKSRGHESDIAQTERSASGAQQVEASIAIRVFPKGVSGSRTSREWPSLTFSARPTERKVLVLANTTYSGLGGNAESVGLLKPDELTPEYILREFTRVFAKVVG